MIQANQTVLADLNEKPQLQNWEPVSHQFLSSLVLACELTDDNATRANDAQGAEM